jgi:hypothetical protein
VVEEVPDVRARGLLAAGGAVLLAALAGCSSAEEPEVRRVAAAFEDPGGDAVTRCGLLVPATRAAVESREGAPCAQVLSRLGMQGGSVRSVEVWGGSAQVRLAGDTVFLAQGRSGWQVTAAGCREQGDAPYDCVVEGP